MPQDMTVTVAVINQLAKDINSTATDKGFWDAQDPYLAETNSKLMLIVSEVAEAMEVAREKYVDSDINPYSRMTDMQQADFIEELADVVIRSLDLMAHYVNDPGQVIQDKMERNRNRPVKHGKNF